MSTTQSCPRRGLIAVALAWQYDFEFAILLFALWVILPVRANRKGQLRD